MKLLDRVKELIEPTVNDLGFELYDLEYRKEYGNWELLVFIDSPEGVDLESCERVSRAIDPILDEADPIEQAYLLTVSSVGIDRPLKLPKDFDRSIGQAVDVKLYAAPKDKTLCSGKNFTAKLLSHDGETFTVETEKGSFTLPKKAAALIRPHIDFN
ncbi:MAG: ribosome maturation factor RimP [Clostridia bacterium]|nr:ribosome maturation factor RimP [Clostridia bacterium]